MPVLRTRHVLFGLAAALLLGGAVAAALSGSLPGYNLNAPGSGALGMVVGVLLLGLGLPLSVGWATLQALRYWQPRYLAHGGPVLALACVVSWFGAGWLLRLLSTIDPTGLASMVLAPAAGAWLGWRLTRRPRPATPPNS
ncbi:hypothetical protein [Hymenobacter koreensis]|uniref:Transmembrane protein n=1 Tax=Hymenobacter koreensis TaxID=1084523 RepID=A0ABP8IUC7_9BACT